MLQTGRIGRAWAANYSVTSRVPLYPPLGSESPFPGSSSQLVYDPSKGLSSVDYDPSAAQNNPLSHAALSFVHGGLAPSYKHLSPYPSAINEIGASLLRRLQSRPMPPPHPPARAGHGPTPCRQACETSHSPPFASSLSRSTQRKPIGPFSTTLEPNGRGEEPRLYSGRVRY